jgi:hypothetical protein
VPILIPAYVRATSFDLDERDREILFRRGYDTASAVLNNPDNRRILGLS